MTLFISSAAEARIAWVSRARCRTTDADEFFVRGAAQRKAAVICRHCPVVAECLADALDNQMEFGVWGGMTERQRRAFLKRHPDVDSWFKFFASQRNNTTSAKRRNRPLLPRTLRPLRTVVDWSERFTKGHKRTAVV